MLPKPRRVEDPGYLDYLRQLPCTACQKTPAEPHHLESRGSGGSDYTSIPLCREHHAEFHSRGNKTAASSHGLDAWREAHKLATTWLLSKLEQQ